MVSHWSFTIRSTLFMRQYPKVLLFGHSFNNTTGMGITLTNLFAEWPSDSIAIYANNIDKELCESIRPCSMYIGKICTSRHGTSLNKKASITFKDKVIARLRKLYYKTGLQELSSSTQLPPSDISRVKEFAPDIVFCALGNSLSMQRCEKLMDSLPKAKLVLYIVDDWVNTVANTRFFSFLWRRRYNREFQHIIERASCLLSICQYMSDEYLKKYNKVFHPFHNPVDLSIWNGLTVPNKYNKDILSILYVGKINDDTTPCLLDMCEVVNTLTKKGYKIKFDIYSPDFEKKFFLFKNKINVSVYPAVPHHDIPLLMKSYTSLFLPLGFSRQSRLYVRLSMPTKLTEYLASGRPMILYCPEEIALAKYLEDKDCAIMCTINDVGCLGKSVSKLQDKSTYEYLMQNALQLASLHDIKLVRERFFETLANV